MAQTPEQKVYEFGDFRVDVAHRMLYQQGAEIPLVPKAVETLLALIERRGKIVSKDELLETVWPDSVVEESNLFGYLSVLRKTLGTLQDGRPYVQTLRRRGYRFNGDVRLVAEEALEKNNQLIVDQFEQGLANTQSQTTGVLEPIDSLGSATHSLPVNDLLTDPFVWSQTNPAVNELPEPRRHLSLQRSSFVAISLIALVAALSLSYTYFFRRQSIHSIAVMPFANESGDPTLEYLSDGLAGSLIERLEKVPSLEVKALSTVVRHKGANSDARALGHELNVEAVLFARLTKIGGDLTLDVELVDSRNGNNLWRRTYQKQGLVVLQSELAQDLVHKLSVPITDKTQEKLAKSDTENADAKELYLRGVHQARKLTEQDIRKAIESFQQAIENDPGYAHAYAAMANARRSLTMCCDGHPKELALARDAAQKAVELDPELAEGHSALASLIYSYDWNFAEAEKEFQRALELGPDSAMAHFQYADFLAFMGRKDEAAVQRDRAAELEPFEPFFASRVGPIKDREKALKQILYAIELDPNYWFSHAMAAATYRERKEYDKAVAEAQLAKTLAPDQTWSDVILSSIYVYAGKPEEARAIVEQLLLRSKSRFVPPCHLALVYNYLGDKERALYWLENAYDIHDAKIISLGQPWWKNVENEPRFQDIKGRVGFVNAK